MERPSFDLFFASNKEPTENETIGYFHHVLTSSDMAIIIVRLRANVHSKVEMSQSSTYAGERLSPYV